MAINPWLVFSCGILLIVFGVIGNIIAFRTLQHEWLMRASTIVGLCGGISLILSVIGFWIGGK